MAKGKTHDFKVWKDSEVSVGENTELLGDKGYQGIKKIHANSRTPIKKTKKQPLSKEQKKFNKQLAKERIVVEHVHRKLKIFRILSWEHPSYATSTIVRCNKRYTQSE